MENPTDQPNPLLRNSVPDRDSFLPPTSNLAQDLSEQNKQQLISVKDRADAEEKARAQRELLEKYDGIRKMGFVSEKELTSMVEEKFKSSQDALMQEIRDKGVKMDFLIEKLEKIQEFIFKPRNSGLLENQVVPQPEPNPLIPSYRR